MTRINTNISALNGLSSLAKNNKSLSTSLQRLSTGLRINTAKDDPAGLIASEVIRSEMKGLESGIKNSERAMNVIATAEGALNEVSALLIDIRGLLIENANTGGMSDEELDANQLQVDSAINTIQRIANATEFEGIKLLNGNLDYVLSGVDSNFIQDYQIDKAKLIDGAAMSVDVNVIASANTGYLMLSVNTTLLTAAAIQIGSNRGNTELTFAAGTSAVNIAASINSVKEVTGISAAVSTNGDQIRLRSVDFGTNAYASVEMLNAATQNNTIFELRDAGVVKNSAKNYGTDAQATINGSAAIANGKLLTIRTSMLEGVFELTDAQALATGTESFTVTGGGAQFAIGSKVDAINTESIGIMSIAPNKLGNAEDGYLNTLKSGQTNALTGENLYTAQRIVDSAILDIAVLRGKLGAFQKNTLETNINSLTVTLENVTAAESTIRDADFAKESSAMTRAQILQQSSTSVLSIANQTPQSVLALLG